MTIGDLIRDALESLGVTQPGESPAAELSSRALSRVNDWIDGLANEGLTVYQIARTTWTLTGASSYTIGAGGVVNVARPTSPKAISNIGYLDSLSPANEVLFGRVMSELEYQGIAQKSMTAPQPLGWYYKPTFPLGLLMPWPIATTYSGVIYSETLLTEFAALTDTVSLPNGYRRFFRTNLVMEIADAFEAQVPPTTAKAAAESKAGIKRTNRRSEEVASNPMFLVGNTAAESNIYSGQ